MRDGGVGKGDAQAWNLRETVAEYFCILSALGDPCRQLSEGHPANCSLHLCHAPIGSEGFVKPTKAGFVMTVVHRIIALAMVFVGPGRLPQRLIVRGQG